MADGALFDLTSERLFAHCGLDELAVRGTLRIALRDSGLDAKTVSREQMEVVLDQVMPSMLSKRGVEDCDGVCVAVVRELRKFQGPATPAPAPEAFVSRTRGSR